MNVAMTPFRRIWSFFAAHQNDKRSTSALREIRSENPSCKIENCNLENVRLGRYSVVLDGAVLKSITLDDFSYVSYHTCIASAVIGKFCSISSHVQIGLGPHPTRTFVSTHPVFYANGNPGCALQFVAEKKFDDSIPRTVIGHDVWIGADAIIPGGISIGTGAVIAAGSVVVKDVPAYAVVGGNPAIIIRYRFSESEIDALLKSEWWDWPHDKLRETVHLFSDVKKFVEFL